MDSSTRQEVGKIVTVASAFAPGPMATLLGIIQLLQIALGWLNMPGKALLRYKFGSREFTPLRLLMAWLTFHVFQFFFYFIRALSGAVNETSMVDWFLGRRDFGNLFDNNASSLAYVLFVYGFLGLSALHLLAIWWREQTGEVWHSHSTGLSWLEHFVLWDVWHWLISFIPVTALRNGLRIDEFKLYCVIEPWLCLQAANWLNTYDEFTGTWLWIVAISLFLGNHMEYGAMRSRVMDIIDSQIENEFLQASLAGTHKSHTAGFSLAPMPAKFTVEEISMATPIQSTFQHRANGSKPIIAVVEE